MTRACHVDGLLPALSLIGKVSDPGGAPDACTDPVEPGQAVFLELAAKHHAGQSCRVTEAPGSAQDCCEPRACVLSQVCDRRAWSWRRGEDRRIGYEFANAARTCGRARPFAPRFAVSP